MLADRGVRSRARRRRDDGGGVGDEGGRALPGTSATSGGGHVEYCTGAGAAGRVEGVEKVAGA